MNPIIYGLVHAAGIIRAVMAPGMFFDIYADTPPEDLVTISPYASLTSVMASGSDISRLNSKIVLHV